MIFRDRTDAGKKLAKKLLKYKNREVVVLAIPRGGVPVGYEIAKALNSKFDLIISRKLPFPDNPEAGFGAIAETGDVVLTEYRPDKRTVDRVKKEQIEEVKKRIKILRKGRKLNIKSKIAILVDDGLAMGSTMLAAIIATRKKKAAKVVVAVPTAGRSVIERVKSEADEVVCLDVREYFLAVADAYEKWYDLSDEDVLKYLKKINL